MEGLSWPAGRGGQHDGIATLSAQRQPSKLALLPGPNLYV